MPRPSRALAPVGADRMRIHVPFSAARFRLRTCAESLQANRLNPPWNPAGLALSCYWSPWAGLCKAPAGRNDSHQSHLLCRFPQASSFSDSTFSPPLTFPEDSWMMRRRAASEREAIASETEEVSIAVAGSLDAGEKLMRSMSASAVMTCGAVSMLGHRH